MDLPKTEFTMKNFVTEKLCVTGNHGNGYVPPLFEIIIGCGFLWFEVSKWHIPQTTINKDFTTVGGQLWHYSTHII